MSIFGKKPGLKDLGRMASMLKNAHVFKELLEKSKEEINNRAFQSETEIQLHGTKATLKLTKQGGVITNIELVGELSEENKILAKSLFEAIKTNDINCQNQLNQASEEQIKKLSEQMNIADPNE